MCSFEKSLHPTPHRLRKVGILLDTKGSKNSLILVMRFTDGTTYWPFLLSDFLNGFSMGRQDGFFRLLQDKGIDVPPDVRLAMSSHAVTPCLVYAPSSNSKGNRIKWAHRRKGHWGGKRPKAGRRKRPDEGQQDN